MLKSNYSNNESGSLFRNLTRSRLRSCLLLTCNAVDICANDAQTYDSYSALKRISLQRTVMKGCCRRGDCYRHILAGSHIGCPQDILSTSLNVWQVGVSEHTHQSGSSKFPYPVTKT
jgi:hypothetical protein